jgi:hypothetical protein
VEDNLRMSFFSKNCNCITKKDHIRLLQEDHDIVFNRVCKGSDELELCITINQEIVRLQN